MNSEFYKANSGTRLAEELLSSVQHQAEGIPALLNSYLRFHLAAERLPELQAQLVEQEKKVERLRKELEKAEKNKAKNAGAAEREEYKVERGALDELRKYVIYLKGVNQPEIPAWLKAFLREVVS